MDTFSCLAGGWGGGGGEPAEHENMPHSVFG